MRLDAGFRLGHYEVVAPLGAGGMGEVYRAHDPKLGRDVAIKILPAALSDSAEALERFEREARAVAGLSHPNILAIHDFGTHEGTAFAVMELLEGETLRARLAGGALPTRKAVDNAAQVARGLAAAHEKGIVHRDLKPENLFVTHDGRVKILDFGLALQTAGLSGGLPDDTPTEVRRTEPGTLLGTVGYMSPEQVRGEPADHRSDIFSLGCVLHEMLTSRRPFQRGTGAETMTAILREDPPDLAPACPDAPPALQRIVQHCLEKSPAERFQSARDVAFDLESMSGSSRDLGSGRAGRVGKASSLGRSVLVGSLLLGVGTAAGYLVFGRGGTPAGPTFTPLTFRQGHVSSARFMPDGHTVVYGAMWEGAPIQPFSVRIGSPESAPLALPQGDVLSVSRSGELLVSLERRFTEWFLTSGRLARAPFAGGAPRELLENVIEASFTRDGERLLIVRDVEGRCRLERGVGNVLYESQGWISDARESPQGDQVAFLEHPLRGADNGVLIVMPTNGGQGKRAISGPHASVQGVAWHPTRREAWYTGAESGWNSVLYAMTPEGARRTVLRTPGRLRLHDIDARGKVLLASEVVRVGTLHGSREPPGERDVSWLDSSFGVGLSSDGKTVLISEQGEGAGPRFGLFLRGVDGSPAVRVGDGFLAALSADGRRVAAVSQDEPQRLTVMSAGAGEPRSLTRAGLVYQGLGWFPDGTRVAFGATEKDRGVRLYSQDIAGGPPRPFTPEGMGNVLFFLPISPDGAWAATIGPDYRAYLCPTAGGEPIALAELEPGDLPMRFSGDGRALLASRSGMSSAEIVRLDLRSRIRTVWKTIRPRDPTGIINLTPAAVTPDERHYLYSYVRLSSTLFLVEGLH